MSTTRKSRTPAPDKGDNVMKETPVIDIDNGNETPAETPIVTPDGTHDVTGDNTSDTTPAPDKGDGGASEGGVSDEPDDGSPKYPSLHFFQSNWYSHKRTELKKLLEADKEYSYAQVERMLARQ